MYYEITVLHKGNRLFETSEDSIQNKPQLKKILKLFKEKFPKDEGYEIKVVAFEKRGRAIQDIDHFLENGEEVFV